MGDSVDDRDFFVNLPIHMDAKKTLKYVVLTVVLANLTIIAVVLLGTKSPPPERMPNPNGYDDFVRAGQMLTGSAIDYYSASNQQALVDFLSKNEEALKLARLGLSRECRTPNNYSSNYAVRAMQGISTFRQLGYLLCLEGKAAEMHGRTNDAVVGYLDSIKFCESFAKGGVIMDKLVGIVVEREPRQRMKSLARDLDGEQCRKIVPKLAAVSDDEEPVEEYLRQEKAFVRASDWRGRLQALLDYKQNREIKRKFIGKFQTNRLERIQLTISFAERAYELDKGKKPQNLADLVPFYLKSIPIDPFTGTNIAYPVK